jgi:hypothetical protein
MPTVSLNKLLPSTLDDVCGPRKRVGDVRGVCRFYATKQHECNMHQVQAPTQPFGCNHDGLSLNATVNAGNPFPLMDGQLLRFMINLIFGSTIRVSFSYIISPRN